MAERSFKRYTLQQYVDYIKTFTGQVRFSEVHVHHTYIPTIADYRKKENKEDLIRAMWRYHTQDRGWNDIAQHATVDPDGYVWDGRSLLVPPVSATGYNDADDDGVHPYMFEMIGNFDIGQERLEGAQRRTVMGLTAAVIDLWNLTLDNVRFHREMSTKTCPGSGIDKSEFVAEVSQALRERKGRPGTGSGAEPPSHFPPITRRIPVTVDEKIRIEGFLIKDTTYVPLRELAQSLGAKVTWDQKSQSATVTTRKQPEA